MANILTLHNPATAQTYYANGYWKQDTYYSLVERHAAERPNAHAMRDGHRRVTYRQLLAWADALADRLHQTGLRSGDRVSIWLPNRVETLVIFLACSRNGYVCNTSLHQNYTVAEVVTLVNRLRSAALFMQPGFGADADRQDILTHRQDMPTLKQIFNLDLGAQDPAGFPAVVPDFRSALPVDRNPDKISYLAFTSGTTGAPKGVMHSENTLLANARAMVSDWRHDASTVLFVASPLSHHISTVALSQCLVAGAELVVNDVPLAQMLDLIIQSEATYVMGVPTHAMDILIEADRRQLTTLGSVRTFYMAGAPIPRETAERLLALGATPQNVYGMTENGSHQYTLPTDATPTIVGTCGRACAGFEIRIWKESDINEEAATGEIGEIGSRGALLMLGYYDNQTATENSFNDHGWFMSGDLGFVDEGGCLHIVGRAKDLIIRGGHNIHPARVEELAMTHPDIEKVAAFGVPDERLGEKVCLAVIARHGVEIDPQAMLEHLYCEGLSKYDMPEYFSQVAGFPLTPSGKILKRELTEMVKTGRLSPLPVRWTASKQGAAP